MAVEDGEEYNVRFVEIKTGISEDGGGIEITVRDDSEDISKLVDLALKIYAEIGRVKGRREGGPEIG